MSTMEDGLPGLPPISRSVSDAIEAESRDEKRKKSHRELSFLSNPKSPGDIIVSTPGAQYRFTVLDEGVVRYEWAEDGIFEDRASTLAIHRQGNPQPGFFQVNDHEEALIISTPRFKLTYDKKPFSPMGLMAQVAGNITPHNSLWRYGEPHETLGGTCRTLDGVDGRAELEPGVISRNGYAALDDSNSMLFESDGWVGSRRPGKRSDGYLFAYGHDYREAVQAFYRLSGLPPQIPRWALGNWWSRYHNYTAAEYIDLMDEFAEHKVPLSVAVLDMDWHHTQIDPTHGSGWTGYTWNETLFPDPKAFLEKLHQRNLRIALNIHPADGVRPHEKMHKALAYYFALDTKEDIPFDVTSRRFFDAYFDVLHRKLEEDGVDFWWVDWQQGRHSKIPNIDPLWMLNHFHYHDNTFGDKMPLTFSRYAGPGSHRYPIGFSGDTVVSWASLHFQPEFTASAANIGYKWWSHDIGGHWGGVRDDELATRWVQLGVYSPILRLHSANNAWNRKEPWTYGKEAQRIISHYLRYRHRLIPYIQRFNAEVEISGPLATPMYWRYPKHESAYKFPNQFHFGPHMVVAPITTPRDAKTLLGSVKAWLPPGRWLDMHTLVWYDGNRELQLHRDLEHIPVFVPEGTIVMLDADEAPANGEDLPRTIEVQVVKMSQEPLAVESIGGEGIILGWAGMNCIDVKNWMAMGIVPNLVIKLLGACEQEWAVCFQNPDDRDDESWPDKKLDFFATGYSLEIPRELLEQGRASLVNVAFKPVAEPKEWDCVNDVLVLAKGVLQRAQVEHNLKEKIWQALEMDQPMLLKVGQVAGMEMHQPLKDALMEVLTADSRGVWEDDGRKIMRISRLEAERCARNLERLAVMREKLEEEERQRQVAEGDLVDGVSL